MNAKGKRLTYWSGAEAYGKAGRDAARAALVPKLATAEAARATRHGLRPGMLLSKAWRGRHVLCTYLGTRAWEVLGQVYPSISAAARAACVELGMSQRNADGWVFFGIERRDHSTRVSPELRALLRPDLTALSVHFVRDGEEFVAPSVLP